MVVDADERAAKAREFFREGYNCTQSVVLAFEDIIGIDKEALAKLASGLGGGVGRLREVCGTVSGMAMIAGFIVKDEPGQTIRSRKTACYGIVQSLAGQFREDNGSILCRDLLGLRAEHPHSPVASERTESYYKARPCEQLVGYAARLVAEKISDK